MDLVELKRVREWPQKSLQSRKVVPWHFRKYVDLYHALDNIIRGAEGISADPDLTEISAEKKAS